MKPPRKSDSPPRLTQEELKASIEIRNEIISVALRKAGAVFEAVPEPKPVDPSSTGGTVRFVFLGPSQKD